MIFLKGGCLRHLYQREVHFQVAPGSFWRQPEAQMDSEISGSILLSVFFLRLFRSSLFETVISIFNVCCHYQICCTAVYCCNFDFLRVEHVWYHFIVTFIAISLSHMQESFSHFLTKQRCCAILYHSTCEYSLTVKLQLPKLALRVRFPLFAPSFRAGKPSKYGVFRFFVFAVFPDLP